jgi:hypothetical protein
MLFQTSTVVTLFLLCASSLVHGAALKSQTLLWSNDDCTGDHSDTVGMHTGTCAYCCLQFPLSRALIVGHSPSYTAIGIHIDSTHSIQLFSDGAPLDFGFCTSPPPLPCPFLRVHPSYFSVSDTNCQTMAFTTHQGTSCIPVPGVLSFKKLD